ncbi:hypothetical protein LZ32DRAFT_129837 [Colletotrichum eremochloae]|nr:hypothetical protein LZ32DRAFT_129837 [Colletotrichum eremochloae]
MRRYQGHLHRRTGPGIYLSREDSGFKLELRASPPQFKRPTVRQAPAPHQHSMSGTPIRGVRKCVLCSPAVQSFIAPSPLSQGLKRGPVLRNFLFFSLLRARRQLPVGSCPPPPPPLCPCFRLIFPATIPSGSAVSLRQQFHGPGHPCQGTAARSSSHIAIARLGDSYSALCPPPTAKSVRTVTNDVLQGLSKPRETDEQPRETDDRIGHT